MKVICALQARLGSTRLPGKALKEIGGLPILVHIWRRLLACREVDDVWIALGCDKCSGTEGYPCRSCKPLDDLHYGGIRVVVGPEQDLLTRIRLTGRHQDADAILRVRSDCLFLDPAKLDELVAVYRAAYPTMRALSNWPSRAYSEGVDAEIWSMELLAELDRTPECPREDFGTWAIERGLVMQMHAVCEKRDEPHLSIDTQEDFDRATRMMKILGNDEWRYAETLKAWEATK